MMTLSDIEALWCLEVRGESARLTQLSEAVRRNGREMLEGKTTDAWTIVGVAARYEDARWLERGWKRMRKRENSNGHEECGSERACENQGGAGETCPA